MSQPAAVETVHTRVLVVEDDPDVSLLLGRHLLALGCTTTLAPTGEGALDSVASQSPDVVFVDFGLPGIDGGQVIDVLRNEPHTLDCLIVLASVQHLDELRDKVDAVLSKPFTRHDVSQVMTRLGFHAADDPGGTGSPAPAGRGE